MDERRLCGSPIGATNDQNWRKAAIVWAMTALFEKEKAPPRIRML
jgi:phage terminase large subunit-like protein